MILFNSSRALVALVNGLNYMTLVPHITFLLWLTFLLVKVHESSTVSPYIDNPIGKCAFNRMQINTLQINN